MTYLKWAVAGLIGYTVTAPAINVASKRLPPDAVLFLSNAVFMLGVTAFVLYNRGPVLEYVFHPSSLYVYLAGVALMFGVIGFFRALALGPVSIVVPIVGLYIVVSSAIGIVLLNEPLTIKKVAGIALAFVAILLVST